MRRRRLAGVSSVSTWTRIESKSMPGQSQVDDRVGALADGDLTELTGPLLDLSGQLGRLLAGDHRLHGTEVQRRDPGCVRSLREVAPGAIAAISSVLAMRSSRRNGWSRDNAAVPASVRLCLLSRYGRIFIW